MMTDPICANCRFFRVKGENGDGLPEHEIGVCDNSAFREQVKVIRLPLLRKWLFPCGLSDTEIETLAGVRVRGDFGCRHFEREASE